MRDTSDMGREHVVSRVWPTCDLHETETDSHKPYQCEFLLNLTFLQLSRNNILVHQDHCSITSFSALHEGFLEALQLLVRAPVSRSRDA